MEDVFGTGHAFGPMDLSTPGKLDPVAISDADEREIRNGIIDEISIRLQEVYGFPAQDANLWASRCRDQIVVRAGTIGVFVGLKIDGFTVPNVPVNLNSLAFRASRRAEEERDRLNPAPAPTAAENRRRAWGQAIRDPMYQTF